MLFSDALRFSYFLRVLSSQDTRDFTVQHVTDLRNSTRALLEADLLDETWTVTSLSLNLRGLEL